LVECGISPVLARRLRRQLGDLHDRDNPERRRELRFVNLSRSAKGGILVVAALCLLAITGCGVTGETPVSGESASADGSAEYLESRAEQWASFYGVSDPPEIDVVRYVGTEELDATLRECMTAAGYPTESNGGVNVPAGNEDAFALAQYTCAVQYPVPERYTKAWTDEEIRVQYRWTVDFVIPCLESRNHPIADPPSESVFVDSWRSAPYFPFSQVSLSVAEENFNQAWAELEQACPQQAPGEVLWDGVSIDDWKAAHGH